MTQSPNQNPHPEESQIQKYSPPRKKWQKLLIWIGVTLLVTTGSSVAIAWYFIQRQLSPLVEENLSKTLNRPIKLGGVEGFAIGSINFGKTELPPTATDSDWIKLEQIKVNFNLWDFLNPFQDREKPTLNINISLINPQIYIEQGQDLTWIATRLKMTETGKFDINLNQIELKNSSLTIVPRIDQQLAKPIVTNIPLAITNLKNNNQEIKFNLSGQLSKKQWYQLQGQVLTPTKEVSLKILGKDLDVATLDPILPLPLELQKGTANPNLQIKIQPEKPTQFLGLISLNKVNFKLKQLPQAFNNTNGTLIFQGREINLAQVKTEFGKAKGVASGIINLDQGLAISAQTETILIQDLLTTLKLKKPQLKLEGEIQGKLKVTGKFNQPLLTATVITKQPLVIDKIRFKSSIANLSFVKGSLIVQAFQGFPVVGGKIVGKGQLSLPEQDLLFDLDLTNINPQQIALIYNKEIPLKSLKLNQGRFKVIGNGKKLQELVAIGDANLTIGNNTFNTNNLKIELNRQGKWQGFINTINLDLDNLIEQLGQENNLPQLLQKSQLTGRLNIAGILSSFAINTLQARGNIILESEKGTFQLQNLQLAQGQWSTNLKVQNLQIATLNQDSSSVINGLFSLMGSLTSFTLAGLTTSGRGQLNFKGENIKIKNFNLIQNTLVVDTEVISLPLRKFFPRLPIPLNSFLTGNFAILGNINDLDINKLQGSGIGQINLAGGSIKATRFEFAKGYWETTATIQNLKARQLNYNIPLAFAPIINSTVNLKGKLENFTLETLSGNGTGNAMLPGGLISIPSFTVNKGDFTATVNPRNFSLRSFSSKMPGMMRGMVLVSGNLTKPSLNKLQAEGNLNFEQIVKNNPRPLNTVFSWNGKRLNLAKFETEDLNIRGFLDINTALLGQRKAIEKINLNVNAEDFNLDQFTIPTSIPLAFAGLINFDGAITGTGLKPQVFGNIILADFALDALKFEPILQGSINVNNEQGTSLNLTSTKDRIALQLNPNFRPVSAEIKRDQIFAKLMDQQEYLELNIVDFPLSLLRNLVKVCQENKCLKTNLPGITQRIIPPTLLAQNLDGNITSNFNFSYDTQKTSGVIKIDDPVLGRIKGDYFGVEIDYQNNLLAINQGKFTKNESVYDFQSKINLGNKPQFNFDSNIQKGDIQDVLFALQLFELTDISSTLNPPEYGTAKELFLSSTPSLCNPSCLPLFAVGNPDHSILDQLRRFAEIQALQQQQRQQEKEGFKLPKLSELTGKFDGKILAQNTNQNGIKAQFKITGGKNLEQPEETKFEPWQWGSLSADRIEIEGQYEDGIMQLVPVKIQTGESLISFKGTFGGTTQSGDISVSKLPLSSLRTFMNLPPQIGVTGILNGKANFSGSRDNPGAIGQFQVVDATINQTPVQSTNGAFNYSNAKLIFWVNSLLKEGAEPLTVKGIVPYQLPFATTPPENNEIELAFNLKNQSLALLNILTKKQIEWLDGEGEVNLNISGILNPKQKKPTNLTANGIINVKNATLAAQILPEDQLTGVTGTINFDFDTLKVQELVGKFGGGQISVTGNLPLNISTPQETPLMITLDPLTIDLKRIYQGGVQGQVIITGNALSPSLTGALELFNGRILLAQQSQGRTETSDTEDRELISATQLKNLQLTLGEQIQITRPPLLNFLAEGSLMVNGTLDAPLPEGKIRLKRGQVNLFTTQLGLAGGQEHFAQFFPDRGLDPYLDVRLATSVAEATSRPLPDDPLSAEVNDLPVTNFGQLQTIRIEAEVKGFASQLTDSLILKSSPTRSQTEIVALLGGGFVNTLGQDDPTLGLANLAGSALFGTVQDTIGQALGLTEFRLFPASVLDENGRTSSLGLAAEASVDVTSQLSVSALKILTTEQPAQFGLRYRLDETLLLRGSTDFEGDSRAAIEYEIRF